MNAVAAVLVVAGSAIAMIGGIGVLRMPDVFARMHTATKAPTLGLVLVALGAALRVARMTDVVFLLLVVLLQFVTAPVGAHLLSRAAYSSGDQLAVDTVIDDLADAGGSDASYGSGDAGSGGDGA